MKVKFDGRPLTLAVIPLLQLFLVNITVMEVALLLLLITLLLTLIIIAIISDQKVVVVVVVVVMKVMTDLELHYVMKTQKVLFQRRTALVVLR